MRLLRRRQDCVWLLAAFLCAAGIAKSDSDLPDGNGKQEVEQLCTGCHSLQPIVTARHTNAEWRAVVDNMEGRGAQGTDEEFNAVVEYLGRHYGQSEDWPLYCVGAGLVVGGVLLGRYRRRRRRA